MRLHSRWVEDTLGRMSLAEMIAQLISARARSTYFSADSDDYRRLVDLTERLKVGGLIFFQGSPIAQHILLRDLQRRARVPMLVSQDLEFGTAMRLSDATAFPSMMAVGATRKPDFAYEIGSTTAREARALGVHQIHAPVGDINNNIDNPIINTRAFGDNAELVSEMVTSYIRGVQHERQIATVKHFPGHGDTAVDSHLALPTITSTRETLEERELVPFRAAIAEGVRSVMVGHMAVPSLDDSGLPASLSAPIVTGLLREEMGFKGLVVTDAMDMQGITNEFGSGEAAVRAIEAGVDMLLVPPDEYEAHSALLTAVQSGRITEARIKDSARRILEEKHWVDLPQGVPGNTADVRESVTNRHARQLARRVAEASVTLLPSSGEPTLDSGEHVGVVVLYDEQCHPHHNEFVSTLGIENDWVIAAYRIDDDVARLSIQLAKNVDRLIVAAFVRVKSHAGTIGLSGSQAALLAELLDAGTPLTLVSFGSPYVGIPFRERLAGNLCLYSGCAASQEAAAKALCGDLSFTGKLPFTVS